MRQNRGGGGGGIQPLVTVWAQMMIGGRTNTEPSLPRTACQRTFHPEIWEGKGEDGGSTGHVSTMNQIVVHLSNFD